MRPVTIARNYAEALFSLAEKSQNTQAYAELMDAVAGAVETTPRVQAVLMSPRVTKAQKGRILAGGLKRAPREFVVFLEAVVKRGRQGLFRDITDQYLALLDLQLNRVRAGVTTARPAEPALRKKIAEALTRVIGKEVIARFEEDPAVLGGVVVRVGDRIFDGSVRRRVTVLRRQLLAR